MIKKIKRIKKLGIFNDYSWGAGLQEFGRYNLIYGWNGSGKTTLSRLFSLLNGELQADFSKCTYNVKTDNGELTEADKFPCEIRVFNQEYIKNNITLESGKTSPIFILGDENKELVEQIKADEIALNGDSANPENIGLIQTLTINKTNQVGFQRVKDRMFTDVAKLIGSRTTGVLARNYRKPEAEKEFGKIGSKEILSDDEISKYELTLKQQPMSQDLEPIDLTTIMAAIEGHKSTAEELLSQTVESIVIERLQEDKNISEWVETGLAIHAENGLTHCEFCEQELPETRLHTLMSHFNEADKELKEKIDKLLDDLRETFGSINRLMPIDKANLYEELRAEYELEEEKFKNLKTELLNNITVYGKALGEKKMNTTTALEIAETIETENFSKSVDALNKIIGRHRHKANRFIIERNEAASKIERHCLSEILDEVKSLEGKIEKLQINEKMLNEGDASKDEVLGIVAIQNRIIENRNIISTSGPACNEINEKLNTFLGRSEIVFEVADEGYSIKRSGNVVSNLSEGEKTAIAFVYFTIHLQDRDFDVSNGIVVVDDPISSLDSNSLFQAFSFLKHAVKDAKQVFLMTHNFDFMRLILGWLKHIGSSKYYMVNNRIESDERVAYMDKLDKTLERYDSEYQYLFKLLDSFVSDGTIDNVYHMPNICRKVMDTFLTIMYPDSSSVFNKLEKIEFDELKKTSIYKFTNDQSHMTGKGIDPALVSEGQKCVGYLLEMIENVFPTHYECLKQA